MNEVQEPKPIQGSALAGIAILLCSVIVLISLVSAFVEFSAKDGVGGGCSLIASALAAGLLANAMLRR